MSENHDYYLECSKCGGKTRLAKAEDDFYTTPTFLLDFAQEHLACQDDKHKYIYPNACIVLKKKGLK